MYIIEHYKTRSGRDFVKDYLDDVSKKYGVKDLAGIHVSISLLKNHGFEANRYKKQVIKKLDDGLYELRPGDNRLLFFFYDGARFVLLHGFRKKTQKTPRHEIDMAKEQMKDYLNRRKGL